MKIMGWRPPQRPAWLKMYMKMPGPIKAQLLLLTTLTISSVTSTALLIYNQGKSISVENTSYRNESLEVAKGKGALRLKVTGKSTTEVLTNLNPMLKDWVNQNSKEKSSVFTPPLEK